MNRQPLRFAQVVQHLRPGGIETIALDLASFAEQHEKNFIISLEGDRESALAHWPRLKKVSKQLIFLNKPAGLTPSLIYSLRKLFKTLEIDVVHSHHIGPLLYAGIAARLAGVKQLIHTEHDAWHLNDQRRCRLQQGLILLTRPLLIADGETVAKNMCERLHKEQIKIIRNGIDTQLFTPGNQKQARQALGLPLNKSLIGCSGRLEQVKGQCLLISALTKLPTKVHLVLAGSGSTEENLRQQAKLMNVAERVHFLGQVDNMPAFYQALDAFCLPSFNEGLPLSPLEAQACAIPTAVTNVGGAYETLCPHSGKLLPKGDVQTMATTLLNMLQQPHSINPRPFVEQQWDVRLMANSYAELRSTHA